MTTFRELICQWNMEQDESYDQWLARLRKVNAESERQREEAQEESKMESMYIVRGITKERGGY